MTTIETRPNVPSRAGLDFNYSVWTAGTTLMLVNVPWNNDYRDIVRMETRDDFDAWFDSQETTQYTNASMQKLNAPVTLPISHVDSMKFNYLRAENPNLPEGFSQSNRKYYYFILHTEYVNPTTTRFLLQLDVWATFGYEVGFGSCYVERGHIGIANGNAFNDFGRDYLAEPEGFDVGSEYRIVRTHTEKIMDVQQADGFSVLVCSTVDMTIAPTSAGLGTVSVPVLVPASGSTFQNMPSGAQFFLFRNGTDFHSWLQAYQAFPWVTQGIISITMVPPITRYYSNFNWADEVAGSGLPATFYNAPSDYPDAKTTTCLPNWRDDAAFASILGARYAGLKKFFTFPYMVIELTTWTGSPLVVKPESWQDAHATVKELAALVPPGQRIVLSPWRYNADAITETGVEGAWEGSDDHAEFLDFAAVISGFPTLPIVNDQAIAYLAQNRNALNFAFRSADWSQQRALAGAAAGATVANAGIQNTGTQAVIANQAQTAQMLNNTTAQMQGSVVDALGGTIGGAAQMGGAGAAAGAASGIAGVIGSAISANAQAENNVISTGARGNAAVADMRQQAIVRDTNLGFAQFAARGDYALAIAGTQAKIQDASLMQPSTAGQFGGDAFNLINNVFGFSIRWKMPSPKYLRAVGDYWLRYGYSVRQFVSFPATVPSDLGVMSKCTYWKLSETYLTGAPFPEGFKQVIRGIFEKGVTVWRDPADIGNIDWATNTPITGVSY